MLRRSAIRYIAGLEAAVAQEFYVGLAEHEAGEKQLVEALSALGVTQKEFEEAWDE